MVATSTIRNSLIAVSFVMFLALGLPATPGIAQEKAKKAETADFCSKDEDVVKEIRRRIERVPRLKAQLINVNIVCKQNEVQLSGWVTARAIKIKMQDIAKAVADQCNRKMSSSITIGKGQGCSGNLLECSDGQCRKAC